MESIWLKNKWLLIAIALYSSIVILFGETQKPIQLIVLGLSFIILPLIFNYKIDSKSNILRSMIAGLVFGLLITPFSFSSFPKEYNSILSFKYHPQVFYWFLIVVVNILYTAHKESYKRRKEKEDLSDDRDNKIDKLLNPIKNKFFL